MSSARGKRWDRSVARGDPQPRVAITSIRSYIVTASNTNDPVQQNFECSALYVMSVCNRQLELKASYSCSTRLERHAALDVPPCAMRCNLGPASPTSTAPDRQSTDRSEKKPLRVHRLYKAPTGAAPRPPRPPARNQQPTAVLLA